MKHSRLFLMSLLILFCVPIVGSAQEDDAVSPDEMKQILKEQIQNRLHPQPDTSSENWKALTDDVGLMVYRDRSGVTRGTLYIQRDEKWYPIAVEGVSELGPRVVPAGR